MCVIVRQFHMISPESILHKCREHNKIQKMENLRYKGF